MSQIEYLIDSDSAIFATTGQHPPLRQRLAQLSPGSIGLSAISYAEIVLGMAMGKPPTPQALAAFVAAVPIQPFDEAAARAYAQLPFKRARFDRLLAAHALSIGATVVTNNEGDFADIPGLKVENWTQ
ncbi:MAG: twitching motility protein PilT [Sphingomonadales bacterium RIFCSPHIGHO2_01_FULL_65_20]|jgi:tRNA(fMet)-specific endonuclease VapC|uniref:type II toxin-antitoxin system VapC family toxin n=1 Tax=Blastomonas TaxID=150203 RepID=UPI000835D03E|nr:type II toxin-antitoxin system VapC family toxin [Sphingomonas ursincola]MBA4780433.1 type II toxin-antitoxin system VapC family toxin [Blastomonas sp.]MBY0619248.1 type II toxin-antitoxin system VapC family toxin [Sphingomonas ursincola]MCH2236399.1 type II toxin-antitoxin system VapC family toxin [Blastomonas sp.]OHC94623.1 MAG: twitching motility protein PilT [Sphingomonadales bacterium RIFCSPHIGHO2_01_FULL_65_20]